MCELHLFNCISLLTSNEASAKHCWNWNYIFSIINYPVRKIGWLDAKIYDRQIDRSEINFLYQLQIQPIALPKFCTAR